MISDQPLISIITPTCNHEAYIAECISSVQSQSYKNWEMVIVDDGSSDQTVSKISPFIVNDPRIRLIQQEKKGIARLSETYNTALSLCQGEWIAILEGDDYWLPDKLAVQLAGCTDQVILCYAGYLDKYDRILRHGLRPPFTGLIPMAQFIPILLMHQSYLIPVTALYKRQSLLEIGGFHQDGSPAAVDMATLIHLIDLPGPICYLQQSLGVWRHHAQQSTNVLGVELAKFNAQLVFDYLNKLSEQQYARYHIDKARIIKARNIEIASACFAAVRQKLLFHSRVGMLTLIKDMWRLGPPKRKIQAISALIAYYLHSDIEIPIRVAESLRSKRNLTIAQ
jgi:glycosyltransferase involved in cell wall biosynthesis